MEESSAKSNKLNQFLDEVISDLKQEKAKEDAVKNSNECAYSDCSNDKKQQETVTQEKGNESEATSKETKPSAGKRDKKRSFAFSKCFSSKFMRFLMAGIALVVLCFALYIITTPKLSENIYFERINGNLYIHTKMDCSKINRGSAPFPAKDLKLVKNEVIYFCPKCTNESIIKEIKGENIAE